jgi:hypothetical protein
MPAIDGNNETNHCSPGIRLKQTRRWDKEFAGLAGLLLLVFLPVIGGGMVLGEWGVLFLAALPAAVVAVGRCFQYCMSEDYVKDVVVASSDRRHFRCREHSRGLGPLGVAVYGDCAGNGCGVVLSGAGGKSRARS